MTVSTGQRKTTYQKRGNVYQIPRSSLKTHRVSIAFMDGENLHQFGCGSYSSAREARAAACAVAEFREKLRRAGYIPNQKPTGRPRKQSSTV